MTELPELDSIDSKGDSKESNLSTKKSNFV